MSKLLRGTTVLLYKFTAKQQKNEDKLMVKIFLLKLATRRDGPVKSTETRQRSKHKKTIYPTTEKLW